MKYVITLPDEVGRRLAQRASETGEDAAQLICVAVGRFVDEAESTTINVSWSDATAERRRTLIDKDIAGTITAGEERELTQLDKLANEHFDRIAPPPFDGAQRLHEKLLERRANGH